MATAHSPGPPPAPEPSHRALQVCLVRPPVLQRARGLSVYGAVAPIGLAYVAAAARQAGHQVTVVDAAGEDLGTTTRIHSPVGPLLRTGLSDADVAARVNVDVDVIGITNMFLHEWPGIRELVARLRRRCPRATILVGGENATAYHRHILREAPEVDGCILGEGEAVFVALLDRIQRGLGWADLPGVATRAGEALVDNGLAPRTRDLDALPRPAWDLLPLEAYLAQADPHGVHRGRSLPILATRGCPYTCTFCSSPSMWTTRYLTRDPQDVVDEMVDAVADWGVQNFNFCDLTAIVKRDWILDFCRRLDAARLDITWQLPTGTRSEALDPEVLGWLYRTGCRNITYAPESGSARMLKVLQKRIRPARMLDSLEAAHDAGLVTRVNVIIGHPDEALDDVRASLGLLLAAARRGCDDAAVMVFAPYPGSQDHDAIEAQDALQRDESWVYLALARSGSSPRSYHPTLGPRTLHALQLGMLTAFYGTVWLRRPKRAARAARAVWSGQEQTQLDQLIRTRLSRWGGP